MLVQINFKSGTPVYLQLVDQVKLAVAAGALRADQPLPGIRPLAEQLRVNRNTVAKAYAELERGRQSDRRPRGTRRPGHQRQPVRVVALAQWSRVDDMAAARPALWRCCSLKRFEWHWRSSVWSGRSMDLER